MQITELTVTLMDVAPEVSRKIEFPADMPLDRVHLTLQAGFGWHNAHLYQFCIGEPYQYGGARWVDPGFVDGDNEQPSDKTSLAQAIAKAGAAGLTYLYDFGDDWEHRIEPGATRDGVAGEAYPRLTGITGTCPPEDIGGPPGYEAFVAAMGDPKHPDHEEYRDWYGDTFDPGAPDTETLQALVRRLAKRWRYR